MQKTTVKAFGMFWDVTYKEHGSFFRATPETPAEYPDIHIYNIEPVDEALYQEMIEQQEYPADFVRYSELYDEIYDTLYHHVIN